MNAGDQVVLAMGEGQARIVREAVATGMMTGGVLIAPVSPPGAARVLVAITIDDELAGQFADMLNRRTLQHGREPGDDNIFVAEAIDLRQGVLVGPVGSNA